MNITITKTTHPGTLPPSDQLGFGTVFTDHMFLMDYSADKGWHDARVVPYGPITMSPAASVLHYGTEVFEGMKAYRRPDGGVQLFRPWENVARLNRSCERLGLPQLDPDDALQAIKTVVKVDENWVPSDPGTSLYIRPFLYGTDPTLALHGVHEATFAIILSPSGSYFKNGLQPVPIMVETEDVRAVRGGTGEAKCGGNYGAANRAGDRAIEKGFSQVLWLDGVERKYVEEGGGMNVMFKINGTVVTPALTGSILRGVTRKSAIELLKSWGVPVEERLLSVDELFDATASGALEEAWCIGTAAVISPIGELSWGDRDYKVNDNKIGALSQKLYDELTGIQWGRLPDTHGWTVKVQDTSSTWKQYTYYNWKNEGNDSKHAYISNDWKGAQDEYLISPAVDLSGTRDGVLTFDFAYGEYGIKNKTFTATVEASTDGGKTWNAIWNFQDSYTGQQASNYIISGSAFRMLVGDLFDLLAQYGYLRNRVLDVKTERQLARLQKNLSGDHPAIRRMYCRWGFAEDQGVTCYDILEAKLRRAHLTPYDPDGSEADYD